MFSGERPRPFKDVALLAEGVDRNVLALRLNVDEVTVALLAEGVDRNCFRGLALALAYVALLAEGVDRNLTVRNTMDKGRQSPSSRRAWIEITRGGVITDEKSQSPSSRRAWIEIKIPCPCN